MKKLIGLSIMLSLLFIIGVPSSFGYFFNITHNCTDGVCFEGSNVSWRIEITNEAPRRFEFIAFELFDRKTDEVLADHFIEFFPQSEHRGDVFTVWGGNTRSIDLYGKVPPANKFNNIAWYYPCITNVVLDSYQLAKYGEYERRHCYAHNFTMPSVQCLNNSQCRIDQTCNAGRCADLSCGSCQFALEHACVDFQCCQDSHCREDQTCKNNFCQNVQCSESQYLFNRTCLDIVCPEHQFLINKQCLDLQCAPDEGFSNNACKKLFCEEDHYIFNHTCTPLNCPGHTFAFNHTCVELDCPEDETARNNACEPLACKFYQIIDDHECVTEKKIVVKLIIELFAFAVIILFIVLDWRKHVERKRLEREKQFYSGLK